MSLKAFIFQNVIDQNFGIGGIFRVVIHGSGSKRIVRRQRAQIGIVRMTGLGVIVDKSNRPPFQLFQIFHHEFMLISELMFKGSRADQKQQE